MDEALNQVETKLKSASDISITIQKLLIETEKKLSNLKITYHADLTHILNNLNSNTTLLQSIKQTAHKYTTIDFKEYNHQIKAFRNYVKDYENISKLVTAHRNMRLAITLNAKICNLDTELNILLENINKSKNSGNFSDKLKDFHAQLYANEDLKSYLVFYMRSLDSKKVSSIKHKVDRIERVLTEFLVCFMLICSNFLDDKNFHGKFFYESLEILIFEGMRDEITEKVTDKERKDDLDEELRSCYPQYIDRTPLNVKERFFSALKGSIRSRFDKFRSVDKNIELELIFQDIEKISALCKQNKMFLKNIYCKDSNHDSSSDLSSSEEKHTHTRSINSKNNMKSEKHFDIESKSDSCENLQNIFDSEHDFFTISLTTLRDKFKKTENIERFLIDWDDIKKMYHSEVFTFIQEKIVYPQDILYILEFVTKYYAAVTSKFKMAQEKIGKNLLQDNKNDLIQIYIENSTKSINNWILNITKTEIERFYKRKSPPMVDEDEKFVSENFITLLNMIKEQLNPVSFNQQIFGSLIEEIVKICGIFTTQIIKAMTKEFENVLLDKCAPGYEEYVIMIANSGFKLAQYANTLPQGDCDEITSMGNLFLDLTRQSNNLLSLFILNTCKKPLDLLYTKKWYDEDQTDVIVLTFEDFLSDYSRTMNEFVFVTFCSELLNELVLVYLRKIDRKKAKIYEDCGYRIEKDVEKYSVFFQKFLTPEDVDSTVSGLLKICPLLGRSTYDLFILELRNLILTFPDIKRDFIKNIISKKDYLNDSDKRKYNEGIKECFKDLNHDKKTIFSSLKKI